MLHTPVFGKTKPINFFSFKTRFNYQGNKYIYNGGGERNLDRVITSVSVTNLKGLKYLFSDIEVSQSVEIANCPYEYLSDIHKSRITKEKVDCYKLSEIFDEINNKTVKFEYENYRLRLGDKRDNFMFRIENSRINSLNYSIDSISYPQKKRLKRISFSGGSVDFIYDKNREDVIGEKALTGVIINNKNEEIVKRFIFNYGYYKSGIGKFPEQKRLKLLSIEELDTNSDNNKQSYCFKYNRIPLPERRSIKKDFLGYYNNADLNSSIDSRSPIIYYQMNKGRESFLPFKVNKSSKEICENTKFLDITTNEVYSKAGILTQIKYPTGASQEIVYESNSFMYNDSKYEIKGGGLRIKKIRKRDRHGNITRTLLYSYLRNDGKTSGTIGSIPNFVNAEFTIGPTATGPKEIDSLTNQTDVKGHVYFNLYNSSRTQSELTQGAFVGYSQVKVRDSVNNGYEIFNYLSFKDIPNKYSNITGSFPFFNNQFYFKKKNGLIPKLIWDRDYGRGKLKCHQIFNDKNKLVKIINNDFGYKLSSKSLDLSFDFNQSIYESSRDELINKYLRNNLLINTVSLCNVVNKSELLTSLGSIKEEKIINYHYEYPLVIEEKSINSILDTIKRRYYYPSDITSIDSYDKEQNHIIEEYQKKNYCNLSKPIKIVDLCNGETKSIIQREFALRGDKIRASLIKSGSTDNNLRVNKYFEKYDSAGNLVEYKDETGIYISYIWGYNDNYLIAEIMGARYDSLPKKIVSDIKNLTNSGKYNQNRILKKLKELRNLSCLSLAYITTYTYKPLVGLISKTDFNGQTTFYKYDGFRRLELIKDNDGNIIKSYKYNYR